MNPGSSKGCRLQMCDVFRYKIHWASSTYQQVSQAFVKTIQSLYCQIINYGLAIENPAFLPYLRQTIKTF